MAKSMKDVAPESKWFEQPVSLDTVPGALVETAQWLHDQYGIPTPISGDPFAR